MTMVVVLGVSACGGSSGTDADTKATSSATTTTAPSTPGTEETSAAGGTKGASPTVTVFARTGAPADEVLAGASEAIQKTPSDVMSSLAGEILLFRSMRGPVQYAKVTKSSVLTKRIKWFTDEELEGVTYLVVVPTWEERNNRLAYFLITARSLTDLGYANFTPDLDPADLSSVGEVHTLTQADLDSVSDWRPFMNRSIRTSDIR
ncbi:hypothetical protein [Kineosporia mesophila]|uniref:hypothetical protein n=1 Tax=Kineosporia mesophila TaxID=566012 RepID=UPI001E493DF3|nr:hypothetical protein [Kineosporia mesophila]MCD5348537.1 hypothetical protein [Kineosporia mesophila]